MKNDFGKKLKFMLPHPYRERIKWVLNKLVSFFFGGLVITLVLTIVYSMANYVVELAIEYGGRITLDYFMASLSDIEAGRIIVDNLAITMCIWDLVELAVNTKSDKQRKLRRFIMTWIVICFIWFIVEKLFEDRWVLIIIDFILVASLVILSWVHDFIKDMPDFLTTVGTGPDDGSVSRIIE